jgi:hypothetical protein
MKATKTFVVPSSLSATDWLLVRGSLQYSIESLTALLDSQWLDGRPIVGEIRRYRTELTALLERLDV